MHKWQLQETVLLVSAAGHEIALSALHITSDLSYTKIAHFAKMLIIIPMSFAANRYTIFLIIHFPFNSTIVKLLSKARLSLRFK